MVVTWNAHMADGRLGDSVRALRAGALTGGKPVDRSCAARAGDVSRGDAVPAFPPGGRSAFGIRSRDPQAPDVADHLRPGACDSVCAVDEERRGDARGSRQRDLSTEPLSDTFAVELPSPASGEAIGAAIEVVRRPAGTLR